MLQLVLDFGHSNRRQHALAGHRKAARKLVQQPLEGEWWSQDSASTACLMLNVQLLVAASHPQNSKNETHTHIYICIYIYIYQIYCHMYIYIYICIHMSLKYLNKNETTKSDRSPAAKLVLCLHGGVWTSGNLDAPKPQTQRIIIHLFRLIYHMVTYISQTSHIMILYGFGGYWRDLNPTDTPQGYNQWTSWI